MNFEHINNIHCAFISYINFSYFNSLFDSSLATGYNNQVMRHENFIKVPAVCNYIQSTCKHINIYVYIYIFLCNCVCAMV